jgi:serine/threonine-protein kinase
VRESDAVDISRALSPEFEFLRTLGRGSMGTVHLAREQELRRLVAIKVPHAELARDPEVRQRFQREARAAARIVHPGAAAVYRTGHLADDTPYLVMEYVEGRTLDDAVAADGPFDLDTALSILEQVALALAAAHSHGVVHRDVRPGNVMWHAPTRRAVLTDFGIAGILGTGGEKVTRITRVGQTLGRVDFSSPEQLQGDPVTPAADVYSLGVLAYHLLTGEGPFGDATGAALVRAHVERAPSGLAGRVPGLDAGVAAKLERCLGKTPTRRPRAEQVALALAEARVVGSGVSRPRAGEVDPAALPAALRDFLREVRRRRVGGVAVGYLVLAFLFLQGMEVLLPGLPLPEERTYSLVVAALAAGFPLALVISWLYDFTAGGIERTRGAEGMRARGVQLLLQAIAIVLSLALSIGLARWILG